MSLAYIVMQCDIMDNLLAGPLLANQLRCHVCQHVFIASDEFMGEPPSHIVMLTRMQHELVRTQAQLTTYQMAKLDVGRDEKALVTTRRCNATKGCDREAYIPWHLQ